MSRKVSWITKGLPFVAYKTCVGSMPNTVMCILYLLPCRASPSVISYILKQLKVDHTMRSVRRALRDLDSRGVIRRRPIRPRLEDEYYFLSGRRQTQYSFSKIMDMIGGTFPEESPNPLLSFRCRALQAHEVFLEQTIRRMSHQLIKANGKALTLSYRNEQLKERTAFLEDLFCVVENPELGDRFDE